MTSASCNQFDRMKLTENAATVSQLRIGKWAYTNRCVCFDFQISRWTTCTHVCVNYDCLLWSTFVTVLTRFLPKICVFRHIQNFQFIFDFWFHSEWVCVCVCVSEMLMGCEISYLAKYRCHHKNYNGIECHHQWESRNEIRNRPMLCNRCGWPNYPYEEARVGQYNINRREWQRWMQPNDRQWIGLASEYLRKGYQRGRQFQSPSLKSIESRIVCLKRT